MKEKNSYLIPVAIVLAGLVLSVTIYTVRTGGYHSPTPHGDLTRIRPVQIDDHILGSPEALVTIVEYSDIDCEYCKKQQQVMEQLMTEYGPAGKVAWVYRHLPIVDEHPNAGSHAEAAECVAELGGPQSFWRFIDALNVSTPDSTQFDPANYGAVVTTLGINKDSFESCRASDRYLKRVSSDFENALQIGAMSAPYMVIMIQGAPPMTISGYVPYANMKEAIESALAKVTP